MPLWSHTENCRKSRAHLRRATDNKMQVEVSNRAITTVDAGCRWRTATWIVVNLASPFCTTSNGKLGGAWKRGYSLWENGFATYINFNPVFTYGGIETRSSFSGQCKSMEKMIYIHRRRKQLWSVEAMLCHAVPRETLLKNGKYFRRATRGGESTFHLDHRLIYT